MTLSPKKSTTTRRKTTKRPPDNFELAQAEGINANFDLLVKRMRLWQEFLHSAYGLDLRINYRRRLTVQPVAFYDTDDAKILVKKNARNEEATIANDKNPEVFLTKYMTDIHPAPEQNSGASKPVLNCVYQHLKLSFIPEDSAFTISGMRGDLWSQSAKEDKKYASKVIFENIKAALILVQSAKAAGWTSVNFGNTADPAKRFALQVACKYVGLDCSSEFVDLNALPDTAYGEEIQKMIEYSIIEFMPSMYENIWPNEATPASATEEDIDIDELDAVYANKQTTQPSPSTP